MRHIYILVFVVLYFGALCNCYSCDPSNSICKEVLCYEDYKKLFCSSGYYVYLSDINYTEDTQKCGHLPNRIPGPHLSREELKEGVREHCLYQRYCSLGFFRINQKDNCTYNMRPKVEHLYNYLEILYKCNRVEDDSEEILNTVKKRSSHLECFNNFLGRNITKCIDSSTCHYPKCEELSPNGSELAVVRDGFFQECRTTDRFLTSTPESETPMYSITSSVTLTTEEIIFITPMQTNSISLISTAVKRTHASVVISKTRFLSSLKTQDIDTLNSVKSTESSASPSSKEFSLLLSKSHQVSTGDRMLSSAQIILSVITTPLFSSKNFKSYPDLTNTQISLTSSLERRISTYLKQDTITKKESFIVSLSLSTLVKKSLIRKYLTTISHQKILSKHAQTSAGETSYGRSNSATLLHSKREVLENSFTKSHENAASRVASIKSLYSTTNTSGNFQSKLQSSTKVLKASPGEHFGMSSTEQYKRSIEKSNLYFKTSLDVSSSPVLRKNLTSRVLTSVYKPTSTLWNTSELNLPKSVKVSKSSISMTTSTVMSTKIIQQCQPYVFGNADFKGIYKIIRLYLNREVKIKCSYGGLYGGLSFINILCSKKHGKPTIKIFGYENCAAKSITTNQLLKLQKKLTTEQNVRNISEELQNCTQQTQKIMLHEEIDVILDIFHECLKVVTSDNTVNKNLLETTNSLLQLQKQISFDSMQKMKIREYLKAIGRGSVSKHPFKFAFTSKNLAFSNFYSVKDEMLYVTAINIKNEQKITYANSTRDMVSSIYIKEGTFSILPTLKSMLNMYCYSFRDAELFTSSNESSNYRVISSVFDFTVANFDVKNTNEDIILKFYFDGIINSPRCAYWNERTGMYGEWSDKGCSTANITHDSNRTIVECRCNHLTNFAVLLTVNKASVNTTLSIISFIGCIISIVSLVITLFHLLFFRHLLKSIAAKIMFNLCLSLLLLLLVFIFGVKRTSNMLFCHVIASMLHYLTLTSFGWMAVVSVGLYRDIVKTFQYKGQGFNFIWISGVLAWGSPLIVSGVAYYFSGNQFRNEAKPETCTLTGDVSLIAVVFPVAMAILFNFSMFIPIVRSIQKHLSMKSKFQNQENFWQRARVTFACSVLLGLTWIFGLFAVNKSTIIFQYLFAILNSLQGFFIFLCHTLNNVEIRRSWRDLIEKCCTKRSKSHSNSTEMMRMVSRVTQKSHRNSHFE